MDDVHLGGAPMLTVAVLLLFLAALTLADLTPRLLPQSGAGLVAPLR